MGILIKHAVLSCTPGSPERVTVWRMRFLVIWLVSLLGFVTSLKFNVDRAGFKNYFVKDDEAAAQVLVPVNQASLQRFLVAFPAGNSGLLMYLESTSNDFSMRIVDDEIQTVDPDRASSDNYTAIRGTLDLSQDSKLGVTVLGSARSVREWEETRNLHPEFNFTVVENGNGTLKLHRQWLNSTHNMNLTLQSSAQDGASITVNGQPDQQKPLDCSFGSGKLDFLVELDEKPVGESYSVDELFVSDDGNTGTKLKVLQSIYNDQPAQELSYLTYKSKFLVGAWRYLSYYGRDDLFTIKMLLPVLQKGPVETVFSSVFDRIYLNGVNTDPDTQVQEGEICNQETFSDYASWTNMENDRSDLGDTPHYGYGLRDNNYLFLPALSSYFLETDEGKDRDKEFLQKKRTRPDGQGDISYQELLEKNIQMVLNETKNFAENPVAQNLVHFTEDHTSGNWRDQPYGNAYGTTPFDVNVVYAPAALRAIAALADKNIVNQGFKDIATQYANVWEQKAVEYFKVAGDEETLMNNVFEYAQWANLNPSLIYSQGAFNDSKPFDSKAKTESWLNIQNNSHSYYALSLDQTGAPIGVLHSDIGLGLLYGHNQSEEYMNAVADALLPFPLGLTTPIGMVISNPAFTGNETLYAMLDRNQYHGSVMWGWQMAVMANGLAKQLASCDISSVPSTHQKLSEKPSWCDNSQLVSSLLAGLDRLWQGIEGAQDQVYTEVWSYAYTGPGSVHNDTAITDVESNNFAVTVIGDMTPGGKQGNPVQLWSYGLLAARSPRN